MKKQIKCWHCGAEITKQLITEFESSVRKDLELELNKKYSELMRERTEYLKLTKQLSKEKDQLQQESLLKIKQKDLLLISLKTKIEDLRKKIDVSSVSQQSSGESQEVIISEVLTDLFGSTDSILDVPKGKLGADIVQKVCTPSGAHIGTIVFEVKNTLRFSSQWIDKVKADCLRVKGDMAVIITKTLPGDSQGKFTITDGVFICEPEAIRDLAIILRFYLLKIKSLALTQKDKESKKDMLFSYLTSESYKGTIEKILAGFNTIRQSFETERQKMLVLCKSREAQLQEMINLYFEQCGEINGIVGNSLPFSNNPELLSKAI